uniref:Uncharacterized protein n=1 Tax=Musa acuminata subsp. malaccensis TaxID=214687 RepID=A0A804HV65_MUSAM
MHARHQNKKEVLVYLYVHLQQIIMLIKLFCLLL